MSLYRTQEPLEGSSVGPRRLSGPTPLGPPRLLTPKALAEELKSMQEPLLMVGNGATLYQDLFLQMLGDKLLFPSSSSSQLIRASSLAWLALSSNQPLTEVWEVQPLYIRPSEAEMKIGPPQGGPPLEGRILPDGSLLPAPETNQELSEKSPLSPPGERND